MDRALALPGRTRLSAVLAWWDAERLGYAGIFLTALAFRLVDLAAKPMHHDESLHAWFSWRIVNGHGYEYDPTYPGRVQFYFSALMSHFSGRREFAFRLAPALAGHRPPPIRIEFHH